MSSPMLCSGVCIKVHLLHVRPISYGTIALQLQEILYFSIFT